MSMAVRFDTLKFANTLKAAGIKPEFAEAHAKAETQILEEILSDQVASKYDISRLEQVTKKDIHRLEQATKNDINRLEQTTKNDINRLEAKIDQFKNELIIKLGGIIVAVGSLLGALVAVFHVAG